MTLDDFLLTWACELHTIGSMDRSSTRRWKLVVGNKQFAPCFVGYGHTIQEAVDDVLRQIAEATPLQKP